MSSQQKQYQHQQMQRTTITIPPENPSTSATIFLTSTSQNTNNWRPPFSPPTSLASIQEVQQPTSSTSVPRPNRKNLSTLHYQPTPDQSNNQRPTYQQPEASIQYPIISTAENIHFLNNTQVPTRYNSINQNQQTVARSSPAIVANIARSDSAISTDTQSISPTYHTATYISPHQPYYNQITPYYFNQPVYSHCPPTLTARRVSPHINYYGNPHYSISGQHPALPHHPQLQRTQAKVLMSQQQDQNQTNMGSPSPKLIWLLFMHRHGDRAPLNMAPRDKYNNVTYWPEGFGNLNNAGRLRMFKVGKYIRKRYENFLTDNIREVYSRSSDVDRCIESSHAVLAGLYPPTNRFEWNKQLLWIPAPVHTVPAPEDYLLNEAGRKYMTDLINEIHIVQSSEAVKQLYADSVKERALLEKELGYEYDMFYKFKCTYSTLDIEERNGLQMPAWYTPELKQKLYRFAGIAFGLAGGGTEKLKKIRCAHLLDDMVSRMEMASIVGPKIRDSSDFHQPTNAPSDDDRRIVHYSTHDSIMAAFLEALNINSPTPVPPGFGATFFIELYVDLDEQGLPASEKYIKLFYMDDTDSENPVEKKLPSACLDDKGRLTLNNFKKYIGHLLPDTPSIVI